MQSTDVIEQSFNKGQGDAPTAAITVENASNSTTIIPDATPPASPTDTREALYNGAELGPIEHIQVSTERIVTLRGVLFDIDPSNLREGPLLPALWKDPEEFYDGRVQHWLTNHAVLANAEVRATGTGLHGILWLDPPVEFADDASRKRWCAITKIVQAVLPTDPMAPGITATTRALGSINSKNGQVVRLLKEGQPVSADDVVALCDEMRGSPFGTLFKVLTGSDRISPCPFCQKPESSIKALHYSGMCYSCGKVSFERFCNSLFVSAKAV
ncbi:MAG TPA: hypothetical protein VHU84_06905 [Lacipirellulaceae bacterium]|nr:hypothetical protein [Lacipirellulaceae bacterium]